MANRAMAAKYERAKRQRIEAAMIEASKPLNKRHETIGAANAVRSQLNRLIAGHDATLCSTGPMVKPIGKQRRMYLTTGCVSAKRAARTWDNGSAAIRAQVYVSELIPARR